MRNQISKLRLWLANYVRAGAIAKAVLYTIVAVPVIFIFGVAANEICKVVLTQVVESLVHSLGDPVGRFCRGLTGL